MRVLKKNIQVVTRYSSVVFGLLFIFVLGAIYAFIKPEGGVVSAIFLIIGLGWTMFLIKSFWDILDENSSARTQKDVEPGTTVSSDKSSGSNQI